MNPRGSEASGPESWGFAQDPSVMEEMYVRLGGGC